MDKDCDKDWVALASALVHLLWDFCSCLVFPSCQRAFSTPNMGLFTLIVTKQISDVKKEKSYGSSASWCSPKRSHRLFCFPSCLNNLTQISSSKMLISPFLRFQMSFAWSMHWTLSGDLSVKEVSFIGLYFHSVSTIPHSTPPQDFITSTLYFG